MNLGGLDFQSAAMIGGFSVAGFVAVWVFLTLRQGERRKPDHDEDERGR
jgi:hypothetical protein